MKKRITFMLLAYTLLMTACGQKGPLYLPSPEPTHKTQTARALP